MAQNFKDLVRARATAILTFLRNLGRIAQVLGDDDSVELVQETLKHQRQFQEIAERAEAAQK
ncbi:MAG: hypothetical protein NXH97_22320 [Rhodobacteraceae bacterium]|nr:hypothetical protein [Paracoccaceae bacterium]